MKLKKKIYRVGGFMIRRLKLYNFFDLRDDDRETFEYRLVFMCGREGIRYLNACLTSIYLSWEKLPEVYVISDGIPFSKFRQELIKWPRKLDLISWKDCALHFKRNGNEDLHTYATEYVYGRKFVSLLYLARHSPILYSDTDVLWYSSPGQCKITRDPFIKMSRDVDTPYYSRYLLQSLGEERCFDNTPFNSGLMYLYGDFSIYPKWIALCHHLLTARTTDNFSEQTAFAILNNHFDAGSYWKASEILIKTDDVYTLRYTGKHFPHIRARHYVNTKPISFWRDFAFMCAKMNKRRS